MSTKVATPTRWFTGWRCAVRVAQDPADLGTAFGLDMSLDPDWAASSAATPVARFPGWMQRLTARRRQAT